MGDGTRPGHEALLQALNQREGNTTPSERAIAAWMRSNLDMLHFNTGAQIAAASGVSEMTLSRLTLRHQN